MRIKALVAIYIALLALIAIVVFAMQARDDEFVLTLVRSSWMRLARVTRSQ